MPLYVTPSARGVIKTIGICDRCRRKFNLVDLQPDGDAPGLRVCKSCCDVKDPHKLPARRVENITVRHPRPETKLE